MGNLYLCSFFLIYASVFLLFFVKETYSVGGNETDQRALLAFKAGIDADPLGVMSSWNDSIHFCQWYGVTCGRRHRRVTMLNLTSSKLVGSLSPYIGNLSFLKVLELQNNSFIQNIPPETGRLRRLQKLLIYNNSLTGEIPSNLSRCSNLIVLSIGGNNLTGKIPVELGYLSNLRLLGIHKNNLEGPIPDSFGNLPSLLTLSAGANYFTGNIPDSFRQLKNLDQLGLGVNNFSGIIPSSIFNLSSITVFHVLSNNFEGFLPADLFISLPNLQWLNVGDNYFTGPIPHSISNASNLVVLEMLENILIGKVPFLEGLNLQVFYIQTNELGNGEHNDLKFLCSLTNSSISLKLAISNNRFGGSLPECIGNFSSRLEKFSFFANQISGSIPNSIGNLVNLDLLDAEYNQLSGRIPQSIGNLRNVSLLNLGRNKLFGPIPSSLGNLTKLNILSVADNKLQGTIPSSLASCKLLQMLDFSKNNLGGVLPPQVLSITSLSISVRLAQNYFTGSIPTEVGNLKALGTLDVSRNMLSGEIPTSLGSCTNLEFLNMSGNHFQGFIPSSLSSLRGLQVVDFSHNNLSGRIPMFFESFELLLSLNLSFNDFEGLMPTDGAFKNVNITTVKGNSRLCGGIPEFQLPYCHFEQSNKRRLKVIIITTVGISGAILAILSVILFLLRLKKKRQNLASSGPDYALLIQRVSFDDLNKATNGFISTNLIGSGTFGSVYKGIINEGNQTVAIKVLNLQYHGASRSFLAECEALRNIRHRNLLKIVSACSSVDFQGNDFKALVYEFMVNGSLEEWLHPLIAAFDISEGERKLNLIQRINIAIDVASAIEYLHNHSGTPIVHCDLKPSNVLLDNEMIAHVGDFGLAKILDIQNNYTNQSSSAGLRGTIGYAPPEYGLRSEVSTKGDVYSYGIMLLEIFTGKRPTDEMFEENSNLHTFVESTLPNQLNWSIDPILLQEIRGQANEEFVMDCLISIFGIGLSCSVHSPTNRMDIGDAAIKLTRIRNKLNDSQQRNARANIRH